MSILMGDKRCEEQKCMQQYIVESWYYRGKSADKIYKYSKGNKSYNGWLGCPLAGRAS